MSRLSPRNESPAPRLFRDKRKYTRAKSLVAMGLTAVSHQAEVVRTTVEQHDPIRKVLHPCTPRLTPVENPSAGSFKPRGTYVILAPTGETRIPFPVVESHARAMREP